MAPKRLKLPFLKLVTTKGKPYAYFNTGQKKNGKIIYTRLPSPGSADFFDKYNAASGARTKRKNRAYTVADMWLEYETSAKFRSLAVSSQRLYAITSRQIIAALGDFPVFDVTRADVQKVLDTLPSAGQHNVFLGVMGALFKWGRERNKTDAEPTKEIKALKTADHEPWPEGLLEEALRCEHDRTRLVVNLLYFTGQRIGDVLKMRWTDIGEHGIHVVQQKRGKEVWVPLLSELRAELARTPKRGFHIVTTYEGKRIGDDVIRKELKAFTAARGVETVPHGLRKNSVIAFLEAGCSPDEVSAITGQSLQMIMHYAKRINRKHLSKSAVVKLENRRGKFKPSGKQAS